MILIAAVEEVKPEPGCKLPRSLDFAIDYYPKSVASIGAKAGEDAKAVSRKNP